jgi:integrase
MTAYITKRNSKSGPRWIVRFRFGGRVTKLIHCGSFKTLKDARKRLDFVVAELAYGRDPRASLAVGRTPPPQAPTLTEWFDRFVQSRVDVSAATAALYLNAKARLRNLAERDPFTLEPADFRTWIAAQMTDAEGWPALSAASVRQYIGSVRQVIDFAGVEPNPARSKQVKIPRATREEINPPGGAEWERIREQLDAKIELPMRLIECCGLRLNECLQLEWSDVDLADGRLRVSAARTKTMSGQRWLWLPDELVEQLAESCPLEDRNGPVFAGLTDSNLRHRLDMACKLAGTVVYSPHDFRHRRISLWVRMGIDPVAAKVWSGHSNASMTLDRYSHVVVDGQDEWGDFWWRRYQDERLERRGLEVDD